jgi:calcineurin-like phosphoesterase family protein
MIGKKSEWIMPTLPGKKVLVRGNHDRQNSNSWWMEHGFDFSCDGMKFRNCWLTHEPSTSLADGCELNIHGHLHNIWHGFHSTNRPDDVMDSEWAKTRNRLKHPWQRLFAIEYTNYLPVCFDKFVAHPDKYLARGMVN